MGYRSTTTYDAAGRTIGSENALGDPLREYTFGSDNVSSGFGDLVSEYDFGEDENHDHSYDAQWSTDALLDDVGSEAATYKYRAFGLVENKSGSADTAMSFVGKQGYYSDTELDLYYLGTSNKSGGGRPYDPATGVFLARDPLKYDAGDENLYRYVGNNPINDIDPSGERKEPCPISTGFVSMKSSIEDESRKLGNIKEQVSGLVVDSLDFAGVPPELTAMYEGAKTNIEAYVGSLVSQAEAKIEEVWSGVSNELSKNPLPQISCPKQKLSINESLLTFAKSRFCPGRVRGQVVQVGVCANWIRDRAKSSNAIARLNQIDEWRYINSITASAWTIFDPTDDFEFLELAWEDVGPILSDFTEISIDRNTPWVEIVDTMICWLRNPCVKLAPGYASFRPKLEACLLEARPLIQLVWEVREDPESYRKKVLNSKIVQDALNSVESIALDLGKRISEEVDRQIKKMIAASSIVGDHFQRTGSGVYAALQMQISAFISEFNLGNMLWEAGKTIIDPREAIAHEGQTIQNEWNQLVSHVFGEDDRPPNFTNAGSDVVSILRSLASIVSLSSGWLTIIVTGISGAVGGAIGSLAGGVGAIPGGWAAGKSGFAVSAKISIVAAFAELGLLLLDAVYAELVLAYYDIFASEDETLDDEERAEFYQKIASTLIAAGVLLAFVILAAVGSRLMKRVLSFLIKRFKGFGRFLVRMRRIFRRPWRALQNWIKKQERLGQLRRKGFRAKINNAGNIEYTHGDKSAWKIEEIDGKSFLKICTDCAGAVKKINELLKKAKGVDIKRLKQLRKNLAKYANVDASELPPSVRKNIAEWAKEVDDIEARLAPRVGRPANAIHESAVTASKHTSGGTEAARNLRRGREAHVFDESLDLAELEARVWAEGEDLGRLASGDANRDKFQRFVWKSPTPIGKRIQNGRPDVELFYVEIKLNVETGGYHLVPRARPAG